MIPLQGLQVQETLGEPMCIYKQADNLTIVNGLVRRALLRTSCLGFREESGARFFEDI